MKDIPEDLKIFFDRLINIKDQLNQISIRLNDAELLNLTASLNNLIKKED